MLTSVDLAGVHGCQPGKRRRLSRLTGRRAWFALRCIAPPFVLATSSQPLEPLHPTVAAEGGGWRLKPSWDQSSWVSQPRQHVPYQYSAVSSADAASPPCKTSACICFGVSLHCSSAAFALRLSLFLWMFFSSLWLSASECCCCVHVKWNNFTDA